jgi:hypothetical protein
MCHHRLAVLFVAGLFIGPVLADRKKNGPCEVTPPAPAAAPAPADKPCPAGNTLPSPHYLEGHPPRYFPEQPTLPPNECSYKECPSCATARFERPVMKTYSVADLVVPVPPVGAAAPAEKPKTLECELIQKITANVEPKSWSGAGGLGTIEYFPLGMALVVNQTPTVQEAVERYLELLRKTSDLHVATELVIVTLSDTWFEKAGLSKAFVGCEGGCTGDAARGVCVRREALYKLLGAAKEAGGVGVLAAPTITMLCGQPGQLRVGQTEHFVTGLTLQTVDGKVVCTPKNESHDLGLDLTIEPTVSPEGKVTVAVSGSLTELGVRPVPMTPVTTPIRPVSTDGKSAESVPFTQFIQEPKVLTRKVAGTAAVPDGGTAIFYGGKTTIQETVKEPLPFACDVPILQAVFTRDKTEESTNHLLVVVTTHVVKPEGCCSDCDACPKCDTKLAKLLGAYDRACKDGKVEDARRLAIECLAIDPTCFGKK